MTEFDMKKEFKQWCKEKPDLNSAQVIAVMAVGEGYSIDQLGDLKSDHICAVETELLDEIMMGEQFEILNDFAGEVETLRSAYEDGLLSIPGFIGQMHFKILSLVKDNTRRGNCYACLKDNVQGSMDFVCEDCQGREK